jgi:hypothetical protein
MHPYSTSISSSSSSSSPSVCSGADLIVLHHSAKNQRKIRYTSAVREGTIMVSNLSKSTQRHLDDIVQRGNFSSEDQAIAVALDLLDDALRSDRINELLQVSVEQSERGEVVRDSPAWRRSHLEKLIERFNSGERVDPHYFD